MSLGSSQARELAAREGGGIHVLLLWHPDGNALTVSVEDARAGDRFRLAASLTPGSCAGTGRDCGTHDGGTGPGGCCGWGLADRGDLREGEGMGATVRDRLGAPTGAACACLAMGGNGAATARPGAAAPPTPPHVL